VPQYLTKNLRLNSKEAFEQIAVFLMAKLFDETRTVEARRFWIRANEPFVEEGQKAIRERIQDCVDGAKIACLTSFDGVGIYDSMTPLKCRESRWSWRDILCPKRYRAAGRGHIGHCPRHDGRQDGRYPTPMNVAEMAVEIMNRLLANGSWIVPAERALSWRWQQFTSSIVFCRRFMERLLRKRLQRFSFGTTAGTPSGFGAFLRL